MTSGFSWQNSISLCPASFHIPRPNLPVKILLTMPLPHLTFKNVCWNLHGKGLASMVSKLETGAYPSLLFQSKTNLLPSVYLISSGLVRGSSDNPSRGFVQWSKVSRQKWKGKEPSGGSQEVRYVKNLSRGYSQAWIFHQHYLISEDPFIRHSWMASPFQLFHLEANKKC